MKGSYVIAGTAVIAVSAATILYRRVRETTRLRRMAGRLGWDVRVSGRDETRARVENLALMHIGHSRRVGMLFEPRPGLQAFPYSYESGTEMERMTHSWRVVVSDAPASMRWAIMTDQDWLIAAARVRRMRPIDLEPFVEPDAIRSPHEFLSDDPEHWHRHMTARLAGFLTQQSRDRSWEIGPGLIAAYEPGPLLESELAAMVDQTMRLSQLLSAAFESDDSSVAAAPESLREGSSSTPATESAG